MFEPQFSVHLGKSQPLTKAAEFTLLWGFLSTSCLSLSSGLACSLPCSLRVLGANSATQENKLKKVNEGGEGRTDNMLSCVFPNLVKYKLCIPRFFHLKTAPSPQPGDSRACVVEM